MEAQGGGDGPESIACAFNELLNVEWRHESIKIAVWIADAPPHGFCDSGDGFPNGCPCGYDIVNVVRKFQSRGIIVYCIAAEPLSFNHLRNYMRSVAKLTGGDFCALCSAEILGDVLVNGLQETIELKKISDELVSKLKDDIVFQQMNEEEKQKEIERLINEKKDTVINTLKIESVYKEELKEIPDVFLTAQTLKELHDAIAKIPDTPMTLKDKFLTSTNRYRSTPDSLFKFGRPMPMYCSAPPPGMSGMGMGTGMGSASSPSALSNVPNKFFASFTPK